jgi:hypothetical protein
MKLRNTIKMINCLLGFCFVCACSDGTISPLTKEESLIMKITGEWLIAGVEVPALHLETEDTQKNIKCLSEFYFQKYITYNSFNQNTLWDYNNQGLSIECLEILPNKLGIWFTYTQTPHYFNWHINNDNTLDITTPLDMYVVFPYKSMSVFDKKLYLTRHLKEIPKCTFEYTPYYTPNLSYNTDGVLEYVKVKQNVNYIFIQYK